MACEDLAANYCAGFCRLYFSGTILMAVSIESKGPCGTLKAVVVAP